MDVMDCKRKNFTELEAEAFLLTLDAFKSVIENKRTDATSNKDKARAWAELTAKFNSFPGVAKRNPKQLITYYKNMKRKGNKNQSNRRFEIFKTGGGPKADTASNPVEERLVAMGALKTPLVNCYDSDGAYHKMTTSDTTHCQSNCDEEELHELIEMEYSGDHDMQPSDGEIIIPSSILENHSQDLNITSFESRPEIQTMPSKQSTPSNTLRGTSTPNIKAYKLRKQKRQVSASARAADSLIQQSELKKKFVEEQHEWEREKLLLEREKISMKKEKHILEMRLLNEKIKMYEMINEKIEKGEGVQICVNINK